MKVKGIIKTIYIDKETSELMSSIARSRGISISALTREAIRNYSIKDWLENVLLEKIKEAIKEELKGG